MDLTRSGARWGMMPEGMNLYLEDQISDAPLRMLAAEITREKIYERLHEELPSLHGRNGPMAAAAGRPVRIEQTIFVERESQRKIVLGEGGRTIKTIGQLARREIGEIAEAKVHLFLFVGCARTGATTGANTARWGWSSEGDSREHSERSVGAKHHSEASGRAAVTTRWPFRRRFDEAQPVGVEASRLMKA